MSTRLVAARTPASGSDRAVATAVGAVALLAVAVCLAAVTGAVALAAVSERGTPPAAALSLTADGDRVELTHRGGDTLDVRDLRLRVAVNGTPLSNQPPVPFFAAPGFRSGPAGPFNAAADPRWSTGETATFRVAGTNSPAVVTGARVTVRVYADGRPVASLSATAR